LLSAAFLRTSLSGFQLRIQWLHMNKSEMLRNSADFRKTYRQGLSYSNRRFVVYVRKNGLDHNRIGISTSRKYGNAVQRNRIRRVIKELYRAYEGHIVTGHDLVFIPRLGTRGRGLREIEPDFVHLLRVASLWTSE
jgi:ribonuclease P protein component